MTILTIAHIIWSAKFCSFPFTSVLKHLLSSYMPETETFETKMNKPSRNTFLTLRGRHTDN